MNNHIRRKKLLDSHGGCWITSDPEIESEHLRIRGAIQPDTSDRETLHLLQEKADVSVLTNPMMVRFGQEEEDIRRVQELLKDHGLKAESAPDPGEATAPAAREGSSERQGSADK